MENDLSRQKLLSILEDEEIARKALQESETKYRTLFESAYDAIFTMDADRFIDCNEATLKMFGCSDKSDIINHSPYDFSPAIQPDRQNSKEKALELINKAFAGENQRFYWKHSKKDKTEFDAEVSLNRFKLGEKYFLQAIVRDITEAKLAQEKLKQSEERYRLISSVASDYMFSSYVQPDGTLQLNWVAGSFEKITGYSLEEYIKAGGWRARLYPDDVEKDNQDMAKLNNNEKVITEVRTIKKGGDIVWVRVYAHPVWDSKKERLIGIYGAVQDITERKSVEEKLRESEEKFQALFNQSVEGIYLHDFEGHIIDVNQMACIQSGYTRDELLQMSVFDLLPQHSIVNLPKSEILSQWSQWKAGQIYKMEAEHKRKDGTIYPVEISTGVVHYGKKYLIQAIVKDVTERKRAEEALIKAEERFRMAEKAVHIGSWEWDIVTDKLYWSEEMYHIFDKDPETFSPSNEAVIAMIIPEDKELAYSAVEASLNLNIPFDIEYRIRNRNGEIRWLHSHGNVFNDDKGKPVRAAGMMEDITKRKRIEERLRTTEQKLKDILEHSTILFYSHTPDHILTYVSPQSIQFLGCTPEEAQTRWTNFITDNPLNAIGIERTQRAIDTGEPQPPYQLEIKKKNGEIIWVEVHEAPVVKDGKTVAIVGSLTDITERKRAEEKLKESEKRYRRLHETMTDCFVQTTMTGEIVEVNRSYLDMLGYTEEEIKKLKYQDITPAKWHEFEQKIVETQILPRGYSDVYEKEYIRKDGTIFPVELRTYLLRDDLGNPTGMWAIVRDISERKLAEERIKESQSLLNKTQSIAHIGSWKLDLLTNQLIWSDEVYRIFGMQPQEFIVTYEAFLERIHPDDRKAVDNAYSSSVRNNKDGYEIEHRIVRKDTEEIRIVHEKCIHIKDENGKVIGSLGMVHDITERKQSEEALRALSSRQEAILAAVPDIIMEVDVNKVYTWANRAGIEFFGEDVIGKEAAYYFEGEQETYNIVKPLFNGSEDVSYIESWQRRKDGKKRLLAWWCRVLKDTNGKVTGVLSSAQDITERKQAEEEILQRNKEMEIIDSIIKTTTTKLELQKILDTALEGAMALTGLEGGTLCLVDESQKFLTLSSAKNTSKEMFDELSSQPIKIGDCLCGKAAETGEPLILWDDASGSKYATHESVRNEGIKFHAAFPLIAGGKTLGVLCIFARNDFKPSERSLKMVNELCGTIALAIENAKLYQQTQEHARELELKVQERTLELQTINQELESFTYSVSHDLRAPLRAITGFAEIIARRYKTSLDKEGKHYFENIIEASEHMKRLIDDLLSYSRLGRKVITLRPIQLKEIIEKSLKNLEENIKNSKAKITIEEPLPIVLGDFSLLIQTFQNLLDNAIKYSKKKVAPKINISCIFDKESVIIKIQDNGIGIDPKFHDKIFNVFQRLHSDAEVPGTGIGLASVKKAVMMMGGKVWVESEVGKGSTFFIKLKIK